MNGLKFCCLICASVLFRFLLARDTLHIVLVLPLNSSLDDASAWERGPQLLTAAQSEVERLNTDPTILSNNILEIKLVNSRTCLHMHSVSAIPDFVEATIYSDPHLNKTIAALGMFCPGTAKLITDLVSNRLSIFNFPLVIGSLSPDTSALPANAFRMLDSSLTIVEAVVKFLEFQDWSRLAIITDLHDTFHLQIAQALLERIEQLASINVSAYIKVQDSLNLTKGFDPRVSFVSASLSVTRSILRQAHQDAKLRWPYHAWIFHTYTLEDIFSSDFTQTGKLENVAYTDGVFILQSSTINNDQLSGREKISSPYASIFRRCIKASALIKNWTLTDGDLDLTSALQKLEASNLIQDLSFDPSTNILFSSGVDITQISGGRPTTVGHYNRTTQNLTIFDDGIRDNMIPPGVVYTSLPFILTIFYIETIGCMLLVCVNLVLYCTFRKEPEVKATSFSVSIVLFIACYMQILHMILLACDEQFVMPTKYANIVCLARIWLFSLPLSLLGATLLVRMIRVFRIFYPNNFTRIGKSLSNHALLGYIVLLQLPTILITLLWSVTDPYRSLVNRKELTNSILLTDKCISCHLSLWPSLLLGYDFVLYVALGVIAFKTRHIRRAHFNDSRRVNIFVVILICILTYLFLGWITAQVLKSNAELLLHFGLTVIVCLMQVFLFVPKVWPPFKRCLLKRQRQWQQQQQLKQSKSSHTTSTYNTNLTVQLLLS